jgi:hypothetical protein
MDIPTSITLDAQGNPNAIFVFKAGSTLKLESGASVLLVNGAQAANVFWVVGTSFTSVWNGIISNMVGTIMAADSITLGGGTLVGRALAQTAAVTMSTTETITVPVSTATAGPAIPVVFTGIANVNVVEWAGLVLAPPTNFGTAPTGLVIGGNVSLFAGYTALVTDASGNLKVDIAAGSVTAVISGSVTVGNFPAIQPVSFAGSVTVGNFPATQPVSGTITALQGTSPWVVSGSVTALPSGIQPISGSVAVTNFPAIQTIAGSVTALISGSVTVGNFPALQNVDVVEWAGLVLAPPTNFGTAPTGLVIGGNVSIFAGYSALVTDASGNLKVDIAAGSVVAEGVYNTIQPVLAAGNAGPLQLDLGSNLKTMPGENTQTLAPWTPANWTGSFSVVLMANVGSPTIVVQLDQNASITAGAVTWQGTFDGINWVTIPTSQVTVPSGQSIANPYVFSTSAALNKPFSISVAGYQSIRALESTPMTGSGASITPYVNQLSYISPVTSGNSGSVGAEISGHTGNALDALITAATAPAAGLAMLSVNQTTPPSLTTGQSVALQSDYTGSIFVKPYRRSETVAQATTIASSAAATTVLAAQAAAIFADINTLVITATAALTTDLQFTATLSDGTASYIFDMETGTIATPASPLVISFNPPISATTAATAWTIALSVATVTVHITVGAVLQKAS